MTPNFNLRTVQHENVDFQVAVITSEGEKFFSHAHTVLHNQATEVVVFMLTNKDRIQEETTPYSFPVAYAMKGPSMSNDDLRYMVSVVHAELRKRSIPLLCEVYDSQWHNYITTDSNGNGLTKLSWRHKWQEVVGYSKNKCIETMVEGCKIKPGDIELLTISNSLNNEDETTHSNVKVKCSIVPLERDRKKKTLTVCTTGGTGFKMSVMKQFITVCKHSHPDLFPNEIGYSTCHAYADKPGTPSMPPTEHGDIPVPSVHSNDHTYCDPKQGAESDVKKRNVKRKKILGIDGAEDNILHLLDQSTVSLIVDDLDGLETPDNVSSGDLLAYILKDERCLLLTDVLTQLQYFDGAKWGTTSEDQLYPPILTSGEELMSRCTVKDLKIICKTLEHHTDRCWFESGGVKTTHVNRIVCAFGGTEFIQEKNVKRKKNVQSPSALKVITKKILLDEAYSIAHLHITLGTVMA